MQERIKDLNDKFHTELDCDRQKFELLLQEKNEQELEYEEKLKQVRFTAPETQQPQDDLATCPATRLPTQQALDAAPQPAHRLMSPVTSSLQAEQRHSAQLSALDAQYQSKLMSEVERYQQLLQEKEALNER
jgi:hypothetical protein